MDHSVNISLMFLKRCRSLKFHSATICMANIRLDKLDMLNIFQSVFDKNREHNLKFTNLSFLTSRRDLLAVGGDLSQLSLIIYGD